MLFSDITILDENFDVKEHMYVGVKNDRITYVSEKPPKENFGEMYPGRGKLLMPAFYNIHSHLPMCLMRGYGENLSLMNWLQGRIFPFEAKLTDEDIYKATFLGVAEMLRYGIAATSEMYISYDPVCRALTESGVKANISRSCSWMDNSSYYDLPIYKETLEAIKNYDGGGNGKIHVEFSLHSEYLNTEKIAKGIAEAAAENNSSMHVHVSETQGEVDMCRKRHQRRSPVRFLADCGIFDVPTVAAHCVHIDDQDIEILKEYNVSVAVCSKGNAKLGSGICPVSSLLEAGVNVGVGTDSVASNNNLNMVEEMRVFNLMQKAANLESTLVSPKQTVYAATRAGAIAQRRMDCGLVKEGFKADLLVMKTDDVYMQPCHSLLNNLVYSAAGNDICMTMVDGDIMYRDGNYKLLDIEKIVYDCKEICERITGELSNAPAISELETK